MKPAPLQLGGWEVVEDLGMVEIPCLNLDKTKNQRKRMVVIECPTCKARVIRQLGNILSRLNKEVSLRCYTCLLDYNEVLAHKYTNMVSRCYNSKTKSYPSHGLLGIKVCDEWLNSRGKFYTWAMGNGWEEGLYLDRVDNDGNYSPDNCRWVTPSESCYNRRLFKNNTTGHKNISKYKNPRSSKHRFKVHVGKFKKYCDTLGEAIKIKELFLNLNNIK
jgi:hypothetical protein